MGFFEDAMRRFPGGSSTFDEKAGAQQVDPRLSDGIPGNAGTPIPSAPLPVQPWGGTGPMATTYGSPYTSGNTGVTGGAGGQDPRAYFQSLFPGGTLSPQQLASREQDLQRSGIRLLGPNAAGMRTKIELPNGQIVDVIGGAGAGKNRSQWMVESGGGGGGGSLGNLGGGNLPPGYWMGQETGGGRYPLASAGGPGLAQPWTTPFTSPGDFQSPGDFTPPNVTEDPGFKFRMQEGQKALERSAAAKGTLLTGGTLKDLQNFSQGLASQEYANAYGRRLGENELAYGRALGENELQYGRALGEYGLANTIYNQNQSNLFNRLSGMAGLGQQADTSGFANSIGNTITGRGDALAQGQLNQGNAWAGAIGNATGNLANLPLYYGMNQGMGGAGMGGYYGAPVPYTPRPGVGNW